MNDINLRISIIAEKFFNGNNSKFAATVNTSEANIRNYRSGTTPKIEFVIKLFEILEINFEWLLIGREPMLRVDESSMYNVRGSHSTKDFQRYVELKDKRIEELIRENERLKITIENNNQAVREVDDGAGCAAVG